MYINLKVLGVTPGEHWIHNVSICDRLSDAPVLLWCGSCNGAARVFTELFPPLCH